MKKVIRLTESDLINIIKRVIKEENSTSAPSGGITLGGVNISVSNNGKGHLVFKSSGLEKEYKVTVDTMFYDGPVSVAKIFKKGESIKIIDNTGKSFNIENTDILTLIKQFKLNKSKLTASNMGATVNLTIA